MTVGITKSGKSLIQCALMTGFHMAAEKSINYSMYIYIYLLNLLYSLYMYCCMLDPHRCNYPSAGSPFRVQTLQLFALDFRFEFASKDNS